MLLARRGLLHLVLLYLACTGAVSGQEQATVPADSVAALRKFSTYFPKIASLLPANVCDWCSCITVSCENSQISYLTIGRRVGASINGINSCLPYTDCAADAFDVTLPASAFSDLKLLALQGLGISEQNGPGVANIKGALPDSLPQAMPNLGALDLSGTGLGGTIPQSWFAPGAWQGMASMYLRNNSGITGTLPTLAPGSLPSLEYLEVEGANLEGSLPQMVGGGNLQYMELRNLGLSGSLPADFAAGAGVVWLTLSGNKLNGSLPAAWASPDHFGDSFKTLDLSSNSFTGAVPDAWGSLARAHYGMTLALYKNQLTGSIPSSFTDNGVELTVPADIGTDKFVLLPGNRLCGPTPNGTMFKQASESYDSAIYNRDIDDIDDGPAVTLPAC